MKLGFLKNIFRSNLPAPTARPNPTFGGGFLNRFGFGSPNTTGVHVTEQTALSHPAWYAATSIISTGLASLPLRLVQRMPDGSSRPAKEHRAYAAFARTPDGYTTPNRFRAALVGHALTYGNAFCEIVTSTDKSKVWLYLLDPEATFARYRPDWTVEYVTGGRSLSADKVVHVANLGWDGLNGYPVVRLAKQSLGLGMAATEWAGSFLGNSAKPSGYVQTSETLKAEERAEFLKNFNEYHAGPQNSGRVSMLPPGFTFNELKGTTEAASSGLNDLRAFSVLDVSRLTSVPPHKLGDRSGESYASIEASNLEFVQTALLSWSVAVESSLNLKLLTDEEYEAGYRFEHDFRELLRADATGRANLIRVMFASKSITPNEIRIGEGFEPIDSTDMNQTYMQLNQGTGEKPKDAENAQ
jgi:HK97 family phage portal protein